MKAMEELTKNEELLLRSFDGQVNAAERAELALLMQEDHALRRQSDQYVRVRQMLLRPEPDTFGPFFAERIIHVIRQQSENIENLVFFFFKKYQLVMLGVAVALLVANLLLSEQWTLQSVFGLDKGNTEDVFSIDLYKDLTQ